MYVKVRAVAGAKKERVEEKDAETLLVSVREPAEQNRANNRVVELVAQWYNVSAKQVKMISGHHSPSKILSVPDEQLHA
jgi:uncharacterized protein YggU (UPF0235/DUF167 family)